MPYDAFRFQSPGHYTKKDRESIPEEDFAGPDHSFPIVTQKDVHDAAGLVGHAADPAAVKARIKAIAKRKGYSLPDAWQAEESGSGQESRSAFREGDPFPMSTRLPSTWRQESTEGGAPRYVAPASVVTHVALPDAVRIMDEERRIIRVCATSEAEDTYGTRFEYEASKDAFQRWQARNIREMHERKAVGKGIDIIFDDGARKIYTDIHVSRGAQDTWEKVLDGTLSGASIGARKPTWETRMIEGKPVEVCTRYDMVELSLVDNASNPDSQGIAFRVQDVAETRAADMADAEDDTEGEEGDEAGAAADAAGPEDINANEGPVIVGKDGKPLSDEEVSALAAQARKGKKATRGADGGEDHISEGPEAGLPPATDAKAAPPSARAQEAERTGIHAFIERVAQNALSMIQPSGLTTSGDPNTSVDPLYLMAMSKPDSPIARRMRKERIEMAVRAAGEEALKGVEPARGGEPIANVIARQAAARGAAEIAMRRRIAQLEAEAAEATIQRGAESTPEGASTEPAVEAQAVAPVEAEAEAQAEAEAPAEAESAEGESERDAAGTLEAREAEHTHADGTTHTHRHLHAEHTHVYRDGVPLDSAVALLEPNATRAARKGRSSMMTSANHGKPEQMSGEEPPNEKATPKSGSAQEGGEAESALSTVHASNVGHRDLANTEDAEASDFGVPAEAPEPEETNEGERRQHAKAMKPAKRVDEGDPSEEEIEERAYDNDGDDDGDEEDQPRQVGNSPTKNAMIGGKGSRVGKSPNSASTIGEGKKQIGNSPTNDDEPIGGEGEQIGESPTDDHTEGIGGGKKQTSKSPTEGALPAAKSGPGKGKNKALVSARADTVDEAEETRAGARLSAETQNQIHEIRDMHLSGLKKAASLCGCTECKGVTGVLGGADAGHASASAIIAGAEQRIREAGFTSILERFAEALTETLSEVEDSILQRVTDIELALADAQRGQQASLTRATARTEDSLKKDLVERMTSALRPEFERVAKAAAEGSSALAARLDHLEGEPDMNAHAPRTGYAEVKRIAIDPPASGNTSSNMLAQLDAEIKRLEAMPDHQRNPQHMLNLSTLVMQREALATGRPMPGNAPTFGGRR